MPVLILSAPLLILLFGCTTVKREASTQAITLVEYRDESVDLETLAVIPVTTHHHDRVLITDLAQRFSAIWSRLSEGRRLPVIPERGFRRDPVKLTGREFSERGTISGEGVRRLDLEGIASYGILIWVEDYGFTWAEKGQVKNVALGFAVVSGLTERILAEGLGEVRVQGDKEPLKALEDAALTNLVLKVQEVLAPPPPTATPTPSPTTTTTTTTLPEEPTPVEQAAL